MSATLLTNELSNLSSEAKRKNADLRNAADKSLQELKALPSTSEQQLAADLSRRSAFIEPFLIACETRNPKFASGGVTCLQRLVISKGLPKTRLKDTLSAFNSCADLGLDIQLKVLQALPSLLQNYALELQDELLAGALQLCASLQSAKAQTVSGVAAATLQQLVAAIFEKVVDEDKRAGETPARYEVPGNDGPVSLRPAAFDAYRVFRDLVLAAEERPTRFVQLTSLSADTSLELLWSCLHANARLFIAHAELGAIIRSNLLPTVTRPLSERLPFSTTVRSMRIMDLLLSRYFGRFLGEFEVVLGLLTHSTDADASAPWKRVLAMEVIRNFFANGGTVIEAFAAYDQPEGGKPIVQDMLSTFVRLSAEKPAAIGLGQQSTVPVGPASPRESAGSQQASLEAAGGMAGVISSALGVAEVNVSGISSQWSLPRAPCLDQLDKVDAPSLPETYIYTLVLECLNNLSESLAKIVLPLAVQRDGSDTTTHGDTVQANGHATRPHNIQRSQSFRKKAVPINPLDSEGGPIAERIRAVAGLVDSCWPGVLAASSTFFNAALEDKYYKNLIKAYQRFAQVAGLLRLSTARDALVTTLAKSAVPPHILNAAMTESSRAPATPAAESPRVFSGSRNMLGIDGLVSQASSLSIDRERRSSIEPARAILSTRNLLCLRALLNLAIALGPAMDTAFTVVVDALRQADIILASSATQAAMRQVASQRDGEAPAGIQALLVEIQAVESAASRWLESTADYPNEAFNTVLEAFTRLLNNDAFAPSPRPAQVSPPSTPTLKERSFSGLPGISTLAAMQSRDFQFVIPKLGNLSQLNVSRFVAYDPSDSGWTVIVDQLAGVASLSSKPRDARRAATEVLCSMANEIVAQAIDQDDSHRAKVQRRALAVLLQLVEGIYHEDGKLSTVDLEIQQYVLGALKSVLERNGETLVAGWNKILAIISSAFERTEVHSATSQHDEETRIDWTSVTNDLVSPQIGRVAFETTKLVCDDFLSSLPTEVVPSLIELLQRFVCQTQDLNNALTAVTLLLTISDHLITNGAAVGLDGIASEYEDDDELFDAIRVTSQESTSAQLVLLSLRLRFTVCETSKEVRNAAFQTTCGIFKSNGGQLSPSAWDMLLRSVILRIAADDLQRYREESSDYGEAIRNSKSPAEEGTTVAIITGIAEIMAQHIRVIERNKRLPSMFEIFLNRMEAYLDIESHAINAAVYSALSRVLSQVGDEASMWTTPAYRTIALWLKRIPEAGEGAGSDGNQRAFIPYLDAAAELYRIARTSMGARQTQKLLDNILHCIADSDGPRYRGDENNTSPLQSKAMALLKSIRTDQESLPSSLIKVAARLSILHHETAANNKATSGPTFIAIAHEAVEWLKTLVLQHLNEPEIIDLEAALSAIQALRHLIVSKYKHPAKQKGVGLWRKAEAIAIQLAQPILGLTHDPKMDNGAKAALWLEYVAIAGGIANAAGLDEVTDKLEIQDDQTFEMESLEKLWEVLTPRLGDGSLPDDVRHSYCRSMFEASIVHATEEGEVPPPNESPLQGLQTIRRGRAERVPYSKRERMSYACFNHLITLASGKSEGSAETATEQQSLAQAAAPLCILRLAIPIRAYMADQPLRGKSPQPLSELEELLFCFEQIKVLRLHPQALAQDPSANGRSGENAHLAFLYPLLVKAVRAAGSGWSGSDEVLMPLQEVLEAIVPTP